MVVVWRPGYRIDCRTIKGGSQVGSLIVSLVESSNHCILASSFLVLVWFSLWVLELMVILMTSSSSSKTEFTCIFYDVFDVGGFAGSSRLEVSLLYLLAYLPCLFLLYPVDVSMLLVVLFPTSLSSSKMEFACVFYDVFGVGGFTGLIRGQFLTIFLWSISNLLLIVIYINIVLAHVVSFPTNLVSLNSESVCKSCGSFGVLKRLQRYYRELERM